MPKVHLHATSEKALDVVSMEDLKKHAAELEVGNSSTVAQSRKGGKGGCDQGTDVVKQIRGR